MKYLATTKPIAIDQPIIMVDGTVHGWTFKPEDRHFDHHKPGGAKVQIDEISALIASLLQGNEIFVTTQVDADACVAAAWCQMGDRITEEQKRKLRAIAWDCDHLIVPNELSDLADFAAQAVATLKQEAFKLVAQMGLPPQRKQWTEEQRIAYSSAAFEQGTQWLISALKGERPFPGQQGEAVQYWEQVEQHTQKLIEQERILYIQTDQGLFPICDTRSMKGYIDPRCFLRAIATISNLLPMTLTVRDFKDDGYSYTLGCIPTHPLLERLDYTQNTFIALTEAERLKNPQTEPWGGRATVGGSPWNNASQLTPEEVVSIVCRCNKIQLAVRMTLHCYPIEPV